MVICPQRPDRPPPPPLRPVSLSFRPPPPPLRPVSLSSRLPPPPLRPASYLGSPRPPLPRLRPAPLSVYHLASPPAGHRLRWREILGLVKSRIQRWVGGDLVTLWSEAVEGAQSLSRRSRSAPQRSINIRRAKMATQDGQYSKAIRALISDGLATPSATVLQEMLTKHPQSASASLPPGPMPPSVSVPESTVRKGVRSFPNGSAPSPSGLCPSHLREAVGCPSPDRPYKVRQLLGFWPNSNHHNPSSLRCHTPSQQETEGRPTSHRCGRGSPPIGVEVPRTARPSHYFLPCRWVWVSGEAIVHTTNRLMSSLPDNDRWTLLLDFTNAFNSISRQTMFGKFRCHLPGLSAWMESCSSCRPLLLLGKDIIHSCCGVQQGDPLGPLGFALTLHPIIKRIRAEVPFLALNAWYIDDGTLVGSTQDLSAALHIVDRPPSFHP